MRVVVVCASVTVIRQSSPPSRCPYRTVPIVTRPGRPPHTPRLSLGFLNYPACTEMLRTWRRSAGLGSRIRCGAPRGDPCPAFVLTLGHSYVPRSSGVTGEMHAEDERESFHTRERGSESSGAEH